MPDGRPPITLTKNQIQYTNLNPLWVHDNRSKGHKMTKF
jgi:hypothetical protein